MKYTFTAAAGAAAFSLAMSASAAFAGYMVPGETMGLSALSPLPEGVFLVDTNDYGRSDGASGGSGVAIPIFVYSTPYTFYNTRLEFALALPFAYADHGTLGPYGNGVHPVTYAVGPLFAHDFGNGLTGGLGVLFRSGSPDSAFAERVDGRTVFEFDVRESLQYKITSPGPFDGITLIENAAYTTPATSNYGPLTAGAPGIGGALVQAPVQNDFFAGDFTIEKTFDKFTIGFVGYGNIDTDNRNLGGRTSFVALGGLVGYDFGKFSLTGIVTRSVLNSTAGFSNAEETRGWVRVIVPLYVAPTAPVVTARY